MCFTLGLAKEWQPIILGGKYRRLVKYIHSSCDLHGILNYDGFSISRWNVDASFAVRDNWKSQFGGLMTRCDGGVTIVYVSNK